MVVLLEVSGWIQFLFAIIIWFVLLWFGLIKFGLNQCMLFAWQIVKFECLSQQSHRSQKASSSVHLACKWLVASSTSSNCVERHCASQWVWPWKAKWPQADFLAGAAFEPIETRKSHHHHHCWWRVKNNLLLELECNWSHLNSTQLNSSHNFTNNSQLFFGLN